MMVSGTTRPRFRRAPRRRVPITWSVIWRAAMWIACVSGFMYASAYAMADRGYMACGGEYGILIIPLLVEALLALRDDDE